MSAHACATQEKHAHSHERFPHAESVRRNSSELGASRSSGNILTSASTKKKKEERKSLISYLLLSRHQQLHFDAEGRWRRAICSYATRGPAEKILQSDGWGGGRRGRGGSTWATLWNDGKTLAAVSGCQPLELSSHFTAAPSVFGTFCSPSQKR